MEDYKTAHLEWIRTTKNFEPANVSEYVATNYYEVMKCLYTNPLATQELAKQMWIKDKLYHRNYFELSKKLDREIEKQMPSSTGEWFVTIGFNHQTWTIKKCVRVIERILAMDWIHSCKANFELYRENGEHPHCHFLIKTKEPKSKILEKLFRPKYVQEVVLSKSFIDVKPALSHHYNYINLEKQTDKLSYVAKDIEWRNKNNIPDYEKNWSNS